MGKLWNVGTPFPTLPTQFDKPLSYLELVEMLINAQKELVLYVEEKLQHLNDYTDQEIEKLRKILVDYNDSTNEALQIYCENYTDGEIAKLQTIVNNNYNTLNNKIDIKIATLKEYVDRQDQYILDKIKYVNNVYSPVTGLFVSIQQAILDLFSLHVNSVSVKDFDDFFINKNYNVQIFDSYFITNNLTVFDFDTNNKAYILL